MRLTGKLPAIVAGAILLMLLCLAGCDAPPPSAPVTLRIGVYTAQDYLPYYAMHEQGLDKKYGLKFTQIPVAGGAAAIDAIENGTMDMALAGIVPVLAAAERGLFPNKVVPVAANNFADPEHRGAGVLVAPAIHGWKDLEGKRIGTNARNSILTAAAEARLKQEGIRGYSFVEIPLPNLGLALKGGNVAAACINEPYITQSILRGDGSLLDWVIGGPPFERMEFSTIVFSADFRRRNPDGVKAFLRAHLAAVRWIKEHPDEARLVLARHLNLSEHVARKINLLRWPADARTDRALLEQTQQVLLEAKVLQRPTDARSIHDETLLAEVLKETR